ncbi:MAG TPA: alpha/beta hydrolase [Jatrophihabitans sp.]|nr:alpha/beta hydrolase [Jatrophihabitans sp.]
MPRRPSRTVPTVLLAGPVGERDWPHWLAEQLRAAGRDVRTCFLATPEPVAAGSRLATALDGMPDDGFDVVAHSVGCLVWLHHAAAGPGSPRPARVALVAPPDAAGAPAEWAGLFPVPLDIDAVRKAADGTALVGSDNDPQCPGGVAQQYGARLKMATTVVAGAGGFTAEDGYGPWPAVLDWCGRDNLAFIA